MTRAATGQATSVPATSVPATPVSATPVYVIDDDEPSRSALRYALEVSGYSVATFGSASAFLDDWSEAAGGVLVSDIRVPGLDGVSLTRRLREMGASLPIILVTGHADDRLTVDAIAAGAAVVLEKPFPLQSLIAEIDRVVPQRV